VTPRSELTNDYAPPRVTLTPSPCASKAFACFPNRLKGKKAQSHVDKIGETLSQVKINISLFDAIQKMSHMLVFLTMASNVSLIISNQVPL